MLRLLIFLTAFSQIFLNRFGLNLIQDFSLSFSYIFLYAALFAAVLKGLLVTSPTLILSFMFFFFSGVVSYLFGVPERSLSSFLLALVIYFPFVLETVEPSNPEKRFFSLYYMMIVIIGVAGLFQFLAQFFIKEPWLFDYRPLLPDLIRSINPMNTVIPFGGIIKSNGFFLLEPSFFSQWMALGIFFFGFFSTSFLSYFLFLLGILSSFSGTGLILLLCVCLLSFHYFKSQRRYLLLSSFCIFLFLGLLLPEAYIKVRLAEFQSDAGVRTSSAAARFMTPFLTLREGIIDHPERIFIGNGPGTINKVAKDFEAHDPVWAKLLFEYGLIGSCTLLLLLYISISKTKHSLAFTCLFFIQWFFLGGHLLNFDIVALYVLYYKLASLY